MRSHSRSVACAILLAACALVAGCSENNPARPSTDAGLPLVVQYVLGGSPATTLQNVSGVAADPSGNIYVYDRYVIHRFDADGIVTDSWPVDVPNAPEPPVGELRSLGIQIYYPTFPALVVSGNSLFVSRREWILRYDLQGNLLASWEIPPPEGESRAEVQDLAVDSTGNVYVLDAGARRVLRYSPGGQLLGFWGTRGTHDGELETPVALAIDPSGIAYVSDIERGLIQAYDLDGNFLRAWAFRFDEQGRIVTPFRLAVDGEGQLLSLGWEEGWKRRIQKFSPAGALVAQWFATPPDAGPYDSEPIGLAAEPSGNVLVVDQRRNRIHRFTSSGSFVRTIGETDNPDGSLDHPYDGDVDPFGNVYILSSAPPGYSSNELHIVRYSRTGEFLGNIGEETSGIRYPRLLAAGSSHLFVMDGERMIHVLDHDGRPIAKWEVTFPDPERQVSDLEVDARGRLVVLYASGLVREYGPEGFLVSSYQVPQFDDEEFSPNFRSLAIGPRHSRTVLAGRRLITVNDGGAFHSSYVLSEEGLSGVEDPVDIAQDRQGDLFVLDYDNRRIIRFSRTYNFLSRTLHITADGRSLQDPSEIFIDDSGGVYVLDYYGSQVFKLGSQPAG